MSPLSISLEIDGYQGGNVEWIAHKPDGTTESGVLTGLKRWKKNTCYRQNCI